MNERTGKVLLYSGGMDSYALRHIWKPDVTLYVDLHTEYSGREIARLDKDVVVVDLPTLKQFERSDKIIPLRNLFLVCIAAQYGNRIAIGATAGDRVRDKDFTFSDLTSELLSYIWQKDHWTEGKEIVVELPFKNLTKTQIIAKYVEAGGNPYDLATLSFSCYSPNPIGKPCGECKPCFRKWVAFKLNGIEIKPTSRAYIEKDILPLINAGTYGRAEEEVEILQALAN